MKVSESIMLYVEGLLPNDDILVECGELVALAETARKLEAVALHAADAQIVIEDFQGQEHFALGLALADLEGDD